MEMVFQFEAFWKMAGFLSWVPKPSLELLCWAEICEYTEEKEMMFSPKPYSLIYKQG